MPIDSVRAIGHAIDIGGNTTPPLPSQLTTMTRTEQHKKAMAEGGLSPYFGWILNGQQVSKEAYWTARMKEDVRAERLGTLWN